MKSVIALLFGVLVALSCVSAQSPPPAYPAASPLTGGGCGMYLAACCPGGTCNRGFVCTDGLAATKVCYTPRCTDTQECMQYAYWTECIKSEMNCNACGFIGQHTCSLQSGPIARSQPCYQGYPVNGFCVGSAPSSAPPSVAATPPPYAG